MNTNITRANRISIQTEGNVLIATFYRTHKELLKVNSAETAWEVNAQSNKTAQREDFRQYMVEHAAIYGIEWKPEDMRTESNKRIAKYENDESLRQDTIALIGQDIAELVQGNLNGLTLKDIDVDSIIPMTHTGKGTDLSTMGIEDGRYLKSGNWAWANISVTATIGKGEEEIYFTTTCQLVSGQLKKPHLTKTAFAEDICKSLKEIGVTPAEESAKAEKESAKANTKAESKGKGKESKSKKTSKKTSK